jgi:hypothetical protein
VLEEFVTRTAERLAEYGVGERGRGSIKGDGRALCWVRSMLPLNISVLILCRILIDNVLKLNKMLNRVWKRVLENEEDKTKIAEIFKWIDEHTKNFHVHLPTHPDQ